MKRPPLLLLPVLLVVATGFLANRRPDVVVGPNKDGSFTVATEQVVRPVGNVAVFGGRPVDLAVTADRIYLKDQRGFVVADRETRAVLQELSFPKEGGGSLHGIIASRDGRHVWASGAENTVWEATVGADGTLSIARGISLLGPEGKGASYPCGLALSPDEHTLYVCLSRNNTLAVVDLAAGTVTKEVPVEVAPFDVALSADGKTAWVSEWGGRRPNSGETTALSAGTPTLTDERGVVSSGMLSVVDTTSGIVLVRVPVGLHPSDIALSPDGKTLYCANANDDTISIVDTATKTVRQNLIVKPDVALPFGSMPNGLAVTPDGKTLFVACGGLNAVAVVDVSGQRATRTGWIPAGWFPGAVATDGTRLFIANIKGNGSRRRSEKEANGGWNVYQYAGTVQSLPLPDARTLSGYTRQAIRDARVPEALRIAERARSSRKPVPVPERIGEPSVFQHVVYIIKENRTYDQLLGDMPQGNGDPKLCLFGQEVTPNHHALAAEFILLDNFYCNGVLSADGHSWATEGNVTDHLEKAFGGFTRSYTFGDDPLTYSSSGFLWDNVLAHSLSFANFGEMDYTSEKPDVSYTAIYDDWKNKTGKITFTHSIGVQRMARYSVADAPGWNMDIPDVVRADVFLKALKGYEQASRFPNLTILYLPNDHTTGTTPGDPTPRAYLADNDLALGQVVEGISKSKFWPTTCVFVVEDDPQAGFDHVDGHRSLCLVVSPYTRRGVTVSQFYNQTSVLNTMERILGLPPMNQRDASSPLMTACFTDKPDFRPYVCKPNRVPIGELNPPKTALTPGMRHWADASLSQNFHTPDHADENTLNRILWHAVRGENAPYPASVAGPHGAGLKARGLTLSATADDD